MIDWVKFAKRSIRLGGSLVNFLGLAKKATQEEINILFGQSNEIAQIFGVNIENLLQMLKTQGLKEVPRYRNSWSESQHVTDRAIFESDYLG